MRKINMNTPINPPFLQTAVSSSTNFFDMIRSFCPSDSNVYFNDKDSKITVILEEFVNKEQVSNIQNKIHAYIGSKMLHDSYRTVFVMW